MRPHEKSNHPLTHTAEAAAAMAALALAALAFTRRRTDDAAPRSATRDALARSLLAQGRRLPARGRSHRRRPSPRGGRRRAVRGTL